MSKTVEIYNDGRVKSLAVTEHAHNRNVDGILYKVIAGSQITNIEFQDTLSKMAENNGLTISALLYICLDRIDHITNQDSPQDLALVDSNIRNALNVLDRLRIE